MPDNNYGTLGESEPATIKNFLKGRPRKISPLGTQFDTPSAATASPLRSSASHGRKKVSLVALVVLVFYGVSGGPFGVEAAVGAGGSLLALIGFLVLPFVWAIPEALVTAELSTAFPEASGFVAWVETAFGPWFGFMEGYMSWISGVTDNSLYPVLFFEYLIAFRPETFSPPIVKYPSILIIVLALVYLNYRGLEVVGNMAVGICIFSLAPFVIMILIGLPSVDPSRWVLPPEKGWNAVDWPTYLNLMFWNFNYWDSAAVFAGEVHDPATNFPRAMGCAVLLVVLAYALPVLIGIGATDGPLSAWTDGHFAIVAGDIGGSWLAIWVVASAVISNIGMFQAELSSDSFQVMGMAERGMLPRIFMNRSVHGTPIYALALSTIGIVFLSTFDFHTIIEMLNMLYCIAELLEFAAFLKLRISRPDIHRPYKIPLGTFGCFLLLTPPTILILVLMSLASMRTWIVCGILISLGILIDFVFQSFRRSSRFSFMFVAVPHTPMHASMTHDLEDTLKGSAAEVTPLIHARQHTNAPGTPFGDHRLVDFDEPMVTGKRG
eukprot:gene9706-15072_t